MLSSNHQGRSHAQRTGRITEEQTAGRMSRPVRAPIKSATVQTILSLAAFALLIAAACIGWHYQRVRTNVAWLDSVDASYQWYFQVPHLEQQYLRNMQANVAPVVGRATVSDIHTVALENPTLGDEELAPISRLKYLSKLTLKSNRATDETLARIADLKQLRSVSISGDRFTFEGLLVLRSLPQLRNVQLSEMQLSMAELAVLESAVPLANLKYNRSDKNQAYQREVMVRYPKPIAAAPAAEVGFETLFKLRKPTDNGIPTGRTNDLDTI